MIDWIKIEEGCQMPPEQVQILLFDDGRPYIGSFTYARGFEYWCGGWCNLDAANGPNNQMNITHWAAINLPI